ncbi:MAG: hypothetical protein AB1305_04910 [Candidatus Hadarchaeota archaeon]
MMSFTQKLRVGLAFYQLYRGHSTVRGYSKLMSHFAPKSYREMLKLLN